MATLNTAALLNAWGSDPNASTTATPTIQIAGDGGAARYRCAIDGAYIGDFPTSDPYGHVNVFCASPLSDGTHTFTFEELAPNQGGPPGFPCQPYTFSVDTRVPTAPVITKVTVGPGNAQGQYPLTITGTVTAGENTRSVRVFAGARGLGGAGLSGTTWTALTVPISAGEYDITATAMDPAGNVSAKSAPYRVTVGSPPAPTVPGIPTVGTGTTHSVNLTWQTPPDGGSPITAYVVTWSVQAVNLVGIGGSSTPSAAKVAP